MGFRQGAFATCWEVSEPVGKLVKVRISTSAKNNKTGEYEQDFSGYVMFGGEAFDKACKLRAKDRIKIGSCEVKNSYDKEKKKEYTNFRVWEFEQVESKMSQSNGYAERGEDPEEPETEENLPF